MKSKFTGIAVRSWIAGSTLAAAGMLPITAAAGPLPAGWSCVGVCGTNPAVGGDVVTTSPQGGDYGYIVTDGPAGGGLVSGLGLGFGGDRGGSRATSVTFSANAGDALNFFFNYVTSDGAGFADYAYVQLIDIASTASTLFTARTTPTGDTVPGFGLPGLAPGVTLAPASTPIIPGGPVWSLMSDSGSCFSGGCGYTDWIEMNYTIPTAGNYFLQFTVLNFSDNAFQSGLAFDGITVAGNPIDPTPTVPEPTTLALLGLALAGMGISRRKRRTA